MVEKFQILKSSHLKIIAMIIMVIDHIAAYLISPMSELYLPLRYLGRISFPIFAFLITEGIHYSKKPLLYLLRLFILGIIIDAGTYIGLRQYLGNVLTTFVLGGLTIYCFEKLNKFYKLFGLIPLIIGLLTGFDFFPLRMQYGPYGLITILIFFFSKYFAKELSKIISNTYILDYNEYLKSANFRLFYSLITSSLFIVFNALCAQFSSQLNSFFTANDISYAAQTYSVLACIFIILYNGQRGYNAKWFQYGCYLFFPLQFVIIYLFKFLL